MVRRGTANPFSPVQIRVSPDRQENQKSLFRFVDTENFFDYHEFHFNLIQLKNIFYSISILRKIKLFIFGNLY